MCGWGRERKADKGERSLQLSGEKRCSRVTQDLEHGKRKGEELLGAC